MKMCMLLLASLFIVISPLNSDYTNMMKWLTENKAVISPKLSLISENEYNRYIITTEDVKSEEQLVFIPSNLFISINHDIIHPICKKVMGIGAHNSFNCLIYFLTIDKTNEHSFWKDYYSFLPIIIIITTQINCWPNDKISSLSLIFPRNIMHGVKIIDLNGKKLKIT